MSLHEPTTVTQRLSQEKCVGERKKREKAISPHPLPFVMPVGRQMSRLDLSMQGDTPVKLSPIKPSLNL